MKKLYGYLSLIFLIFCLCGCGQAAVSEETEQKIDQIDWRSKGFAEAQKETEQQELWAEKYLPMQREGLVPEVEAEAENHEVKEEGGCAGKWLRRHTYYIGEELERRKQYAEVYDVESGQREMIELTMENIGLEADSGDTETVGFAYIDDMDMTADGRYAILLTRRAVDAEKGFYFSKIQIVISALDGTPAEVTDVREQFLEKGIFKDEEALTMADTECDYDASGNIYVRSGNSENPNRELYIFDREGKLLAEQRFGEQEYVDPPARTEDGELIFAVRDLQAGRTRMMWFDPEAQRLKTLAEVEEQNWKQVYGLWGNEFYYAAPGGIVRWNIESGERVKVFDFGENGVSTLFQTMFTILDSGESVFRMYGKIAENSEDWVTAMSREEIEKQDALQVTSMLSTGVRKVETCAAVASRRNPNLSYVYRAGESTADYRNRMIAEIVAGGGPDILYLSREDFDLFVQKGLLMELDSVIHEETLEQVLPGAIGLGTVDGHLYGLPPEISPETLITLKEIWQEDSWTLDDLMALLDTGNFTGFICQRDGSFGQRAVLSFFVEYGLNNSVLIDWENGESHFDDEIFLKMIEYAKEYGDVEPGPGSRLGIGETIADCSPGYTLASINDTYERYGDDYFFVGQPTDGDCGNYVDCEGIVAVNKNAADPEAVAFYFETLKSQEIQQLRPENVTILSICRISKESPLYRETGEGIYWDGEKAIQKPDGSTTLQDWSGYLERCVPGPPDYQDLKNVIWEEAEGYFNGDKSAETVAEIIDRRIQLYLDEK